MGACFSIDSEERKAKLRSEQIDVELEESSKEDKSVKILLLGAGESGKSTLVKQMKIIHSDGFTIADLLSFKPAVLDNLVSSMRYVLSGMGQLRIPLANYRNKVHAQTILQCYRCFDENIVMRPAIAVALRALWKDSGVRSCAIRGNEYELNDSAIYYFDNMERILMEKYTPTTEDVLRARVRTTGVLETSFTVGGVPLRIIDVGGQRSERKKWIHCFEHVSAVIFVAALSGYDMTLFEDPEVNRLRESLAVFKPICNNRFFSNISMILFLNKVDLFQQKILLTKRKLRIYFPEYKGPDYDVDAAASFIQGLFELCDERMNVRGSPIFTHFTTATDTSNIQVVFEGVVESIIRSNIRRIDLH
ncbi:Guanine nucleotide-binding protein G(o) subunit alpha [Holothuria leucospilota]|uniref:Guanine nucleotide-binding protein G(O) subunit alpha n=1 Tax=Holothuria leucospilota TaxID=206669 RepID=A0A9Q1C4V1_HOLLE|nr:Guanine nucleotide-binding protein G(o) subunit alpha [Holothuria leucospilota]